MDKASKALRRSSVRLKSMGSGHRELNMVISELRDVRSTAKAFTVAQNTATQDMLKWSMNEENPAIQDTFLQLAELSAIWTEVQREFTDHLKEFITQFEMMLEGEQHIDQARTHITACELRAAKIRKELKKAAKRGSEEEVNQLEARLTQAEKSCDNAQIEVLDHIQEHEAVKLIRVKEGLLKLSESYLKLAHKCHVIHEAHHDIAVQIPDVHNKDLHEMKYAGPGAAKQAVQRAKEQIHAYRRHIHNITPCAPIPEGPPPPYSLTNHDSAPYNPHYLPDSSNPFHSCLPEVGEEHASQNQASFSSSTNPFEDDVDNSRSLDSPLNRLTVTADPSYEDDLAGAMAQVKT